MSLVKLFNQPTLSLTTDWLRANVESTKLLHVVTDVFFHFDFDGIVARQLFLVADTLPLFHHQTMCQLPSEEFKIIDILDSPLFTVHLLIAVQAIHHDRRNLSFEGVPALLQVASFGSRGRGGDRE